MHCFDFSISSSAMWHAVLRFLNSSFISAFLSALAGAAFGVWGAQKLAERSIQIKELTDALRQANGIIVLAAMIANQALVLKKQFVKPLSDKYFKDREEAKLIREKMLRGDPPPQTLPIFKADLIKITPLTLPVEALKSQIYSANLMPGQALALLSMIEQSVQDLAHVIKIRSERIEAFHEASLSLGSLPPKMMVHDYFGIQQDGNTNAMYYDAMVALSLYTNDVAFLGAELVDHLHAHAERVRSKLLKLRRDVPKAYSVDFSEARESGLMPPRADYHSWLSGFTTNA